ncbi:MAG: class I SAM-dependent methyltransferase [Thiobacillus sp.]|nr:class I SAM-dependent methyltransferase [Thiobacillus sp.]
MFETYQRLTARFKRSRLAVAFTRHGDTRPAREVFLEIYKSNYWGNTDSRSGGGSDLTQTAELRRCLPPLLTDLNVHSMLDVPCGDWHWMKETTIDVEYIGADIVPELIQRNQELYGDSRHRFLALDLTRDQLPTADLILARDVLVHLSFEDILAALRNIKRSGAEYLLTTTFTARPRNVDIRTGNWRPLNLQAPPFNFPEPLALINEKCTEGDGSWGDKSLGLWRVGALPAS